jgi:8-oxo-dGTP pyrophosphatase MutT (NUDIX family)/phosphohistidine phosphatase SixA
VADPGTVRAAGGVLWRRVDSQLQVALVHRPKYGDWSLPKGKLDAGEAAVVGAVREVREETGFTGIPGPRLGESRYRVLHRGRDAKKVVQWWAMRAGDGEFVPDAEVDALRWLPLQSAMARVSSGHDGDPLRAFAEHPPESTTLLLVRHGWAGSRQSWDGPDELRPLDERGQQQARAAAEVLAAYCPERVLSAPLTRCTETVRPLAERLGLPVEFAPAAAETENPRGAKLLVDLLQELAAAGSPAVVCSQGGVIPDAVGALAADAGLAVEARARKGSLWALTFTSGGLVDADHLERLDV